MVIIGVVLVAALIAAVWWGSRRTSRRAPPPTPAEQPHYPAGTDRAPGEIQEDPESNELPLRDTRLTPHNLKDGDTEH
ncbi:hypothetical protein GCM10009612_72260 [Streptomyces beijiangensis]